MGLFFAFFGHFWAQNATILQMQKGRNFVFDTLIFGNLFKSLACHKFFPQMCKISQGGRGRGLDRLRGEEGQEGLHREALREKRRANALILGEMVTLCMVFQKK